MLHGHVDPAEYAWKLPAPAAQHPLVATPIWSAEDWLDSFADAGRNKDREAFHSLRREVFQSTVEAVRDRGYSVTGERIDLDGHDEYDTLHRGTEFHTSTDELIVADGLRGQFETVVRVVNVDCLEAASLHCHGSELPAVLNMASSHNPGGWVVGGSGAQEENLFRRSNLLWSLYQYAPFAAEYGVPEDPGGHRYPIPSESGGIYSPPAWVFRSSEATGYAFLAEPYQTAFITVPAISHPDTIPVGKTARLTEPMAQSTLRKIRAILRIGADHGHHDLVLGAFGCGAFRNPPEHMAELFRETLDEEEFRGAFRNIVFAVLDDHNAVRHRSRQGNFRPFKHVLDPG